MCNHLDNHFFLCLGGGRQLLPPGAPLTNFNELGGVGSVDFWGVVKNIHKFFGVLYFSSAQINNNIGLIYYWCEILGYAKK